MSGNNNHKLQPPAYLLLAMLIMILCHFLCPLEEIIAYPWNISGLLPLAIGIILNLMADHAIKKYHTTVKSFATPSFLITVGVFKISRNPMYLGMVLLLLGLSILSGSVSVLLMVPIFAFLIHFKFIRMEERTLEEKFGRFWESYKIRVKRWI